jgi:hypothetical protein
MNVRTNREEVDLKKFEVNHGPHGEVQSVELAGYSFRGLPIDNPEAPECLCKKAKDPGTGTSRYFVKFVMAGSNAGNMIDPNDETDLKRRGDWTAAGHFGFRPVSQLAFDLYLKFLQTGNQAWRRQASRELET